MEVVHVIRQYTPSVGGLEDSTRNLCLHLSRMEGMHVRIVTLNRVFSDKATVLPSHERIDGIEVTRLPFFGSSRYPIAPDVLKAIASADLVHVHAVDFFFDFLSLMRFLHRKPLVASTHGGFFHTAFAARLKKIYFQTITRFCSAGYRAICASSENDAQTFRRISPRNVVTIENGVNVDKWQDAGSKSPTRTLLFIGRWSANKRVPVLISLLAELRALHPQWRLVIAGLPADDTGKTIRDAAQHHQLGDAVQIAESPNENDIRTLIGTASYICSASSYEGFGISIIEGLSAGLYPVITALPPFQKLLNGLGFGVTLLPDQLRQTAQQIEAAHARLLTEGEALRKQAIEFSRRFAWDGVARQFMQVYRAALSS